MYLSLLRRQVRAISIIACALALLVTPSLASGLAPTPAQGGIELLLGIDAERNSPVPLEGQVLEGDAHIFTSETPEISDVFFFLDVPSATGPVFQHESHAPYDFAGTAAGNLNRPFDTTTLPDGLHRIEIVVIFDDGSIEEAGADFIVQNSQIGQLLFTPFSFDLVVPEQGTVTAAATLETTQNEVISFDLAESADWLTLGALSGTTPAQIDLTIDSTGLPPGFYTTDVVASADGRPDVNLTVQVEVESTAGDLVLTPAALSLELASGESETLSFEITTEENGNVPFTLFESSPWLTLSSFSGTTPASVNAIVDASALADGVFQTTIVAASPGRPSVSVVVDLVVQSPPPVFAFMPGSVEIELEPDSFGMATVQLDNLEGFVAMFELIESADWLELSSLSGTTPATFDLLFDSTGLAPGVFQTNVEAFREGAASAFLSVELSVGDDGFCTPLPCQDILVDLPVALEFLADAGGIDDQFGVGTGFTTIDAPNGADSYRPDLLTVNTAEGLLELTTTRGIHFRGANDQVNTLGVGFDASAGVSVVRTTLVEPTVGTGNFEQGGLFLGTDDDNYIKFVVASTRNGSIVQALLEVDGTPVFQRSTSPIDFTQVDIELEMEIQPEFGAVICYASLNGAPRTVIATVFPPEFILNLDPDVVDPAIGTSSFAGVFGTHRFGPQPVVWSFRGFEIDPQGSTGAPELVFSQDDLSLTVEPDAQASQNVTLDVTSGAPVAYTLEETIPWLELDALSGMTPGTITFTVDSTGLPDGVFEGTVTATANGLEPLEFPVSLTVETPVGDLVFSPASVGFELAPAEMETRSVVLSTSGASETNFVLTGGASWLTLNQLSGSTPATLELTADATGLADGVFQATLLASSPDAPDVTLSVELVVASPGGAFVLAPASLDFVLGAFSQDVAAANVSATTGEAIPFTITESEDWLSVSQTTGVTPASFDVMVDSSGLSDGVFVAEVIIARDGDGPGFADQTLTVQLTVGTMGDCFPLPCDQVLVDLPYTLTFAQDEGGILDSGGVGTGFTTIDAPDDSDGYRPDLLVVNTFDAVLELTTTRGLHHRDANSQDNTLGVGVDVSSQTATARTTLLEPNVGTGRFEQAGLWFGVDNDNFVKFVVASTRSGSLLQGVIEVNGVPVDTTNDLPMDFTGMDVELELLIDPVTLMVTGFAQVGTQARREIFSFSAPPAFFSLEPSVINPQIGVSSFVGVFGSHRFGPSPVVYRFSDFSVE